MKSELFLKELLESFSYKIQEIYHGCRVLNFDDLDFQPFRLDYSYFFILEFSCGPLFSDKFCILVCGNNIRHIKRLIRSVLCFLSNDQLSYLVSIECLSFKYEFFQSYVYDPISVSLRRPHQSFSSCYSEYYKYLLPYVS